MKFQLWNLMFSNGFTVLICALLLSSCSIPSKVPPLNSGRVNLDSIQLNFREEILSQFEESEETPLEIAPTSGTDQTAEVLPEPSSELKNWRAEISESWSQIPNDKFYLVCKILYESIFDSEAAFGGNFTEVRSRFKRDGVTFYSLTDIQLAADNRKTIQFPTSKISSSLFVCSSLVSLKQANGDIGPPQKSTVAWTYYLDGDEIKYTVSFGLGN
jgi:hypothetical protein